MTTRTFDVIALTEDRNGEVAQSEPQIELEVSEIATTREMHNLSDYDAVIHELGLALMHEPYNASVVAICNFSEI